MKPPANVEIHYTCGKTRRIFANSMAFHLAISLISIFNTRRQKKKPGCKITVTKSAKEFIKTELEM